MKIKPKNKLVMIGDSITDASRTRPVGEGLFEAHGKGYVNLVNSLLWAVYPGHQIRVVNMGCGGNTVQGEQRPFCCANRGVYLLLLVGVQDVGGC